MLICIPGKKLRHILKSGDQVPGIAQPSSYFNAQSDQPFHNLKKSRIISSYVCLERAIPLLVKQSWSLSLSNLGIDVDKSAHLEGIRDTEPSIEQRENDEATNININSEIERIEPPHELLRVMDSKISEIIGILRRHFSIIPDFRHMPGLKIRIPCSLRFKSELFDHIQGADLPSYGCDGLDVLPAIYAAVLTFSSSAPYGSIPSNHVPFLLGEPPSKDYSLGQTHSLAVVPIDDGCSEEGFKASVTIELEPQEPVPGLVDVSIEANIENGQIIRGQLQSITVGIEDMFLRAIVPPGISDNAIPDYYLELFRALWEACGSSTNTGHEVFSLKGGKGVAAISGTRSVKLLEVPVTALVQAVEHYMAPFVVSVIGEPLVDIVKNGGIINNVIWKDRTSDSTLEVAISDTNFDKGPLYLKYTEDGDDRDCHLHVSKKNMGCFLILIFLPPRFHLLFQMEVCDVSTLVRIRTDHWPCLAYIDDYLEALFSE